MNDIIKDNSLATTTLSIGQILKIETKQDETITQEAWYGEIDKIEELSNTIIYTVQKNDSLYSISKKYNTTVSRITELNNLTSNLLSIGQQLIIERVMQYRTKFNLSNFLK